jgi:hypothetical protein
MTKDVVFPKLNWDFAKRYVGESLLRTAFNYVEGDPNNNIPRLLSVLEKITPLPEHKEYIRYVLTTYQQQARGEKHLPSQRYPVLTRYHPTFVEYQRTGQYGPLYVTYAITPTLTCPPLTSILPSRRVIGRLNPVVRMDIKILFQKPVQSR